VQRREAAVAEWVAKHTTAKEEWVAKHAAAKEEWVARHAATAKEREMMLAENEALETKVELLEKVSRHAS
jgi:hypothetical protein